MKQYHLTRGAHGCFLLIVKCSFNKIKILCEAMRVPEKSFRLSYSNTHLRICETLPFKYNFLTAAFLKKPHSCDGCTYVAVDILCTYTYSMSEWGLEDLTHAIYVCRFCLHLSGLGLGGLNTCFI